MWISQIPSSLDLSSFLTILSNNNGVKGSEQKRNKCLVLGKHMEHRAAENSQLQQQMMDYMELQGCQCQDKVIEKEVFSVAGGVKGV